MGYRYGPPPKPENMLHKFDVRNGAIMRMAFGCYYAENGHNRAFHDYVGWPDPRNPDHICQVKPVYDRHWHPFPNSKRPIKMTPIQLLDEGYRYVSVSFEDEEIAQHIIVTRAEIDSEDQNIVRVSMRADFPVFHDKPLQTRFTVFIADELETTIDAVIHGIVVILPGMTYVSPADTGDTFEQGA